jgi:sugar O-acyltransferase (sialic acid O-acetyltransferase NeuD family)
MNTSAIPVTVPLLNPNEPEARLVAIAVHDHEMVHPGDILCTLETTKSAADLVAEVEGYVYGLQAQIGDSLKAGQLLCYLAPSPEWVPAVSPSLSEDDLAARAQPAPAGEIPADLRITRPALDLAKQANLDLGLLPIGPLVTEGDVRQLLGQPVELDSTIQGGPIALTIYGGGGHGKALIELVRATKSYKLVGIIDDGLKPGECILDLPVLGSGQILKSLQERGINLAANAVGGIGNLQARLAIFEQLAEAGFTCPTLVHPSAVVEPSAKLSLGVQVMPLSYVGSQAQLGFGVLVNTSAVVSHDCTVGDYSNLSPGALVAGEVHIGRSVLVGMGATINLGVGIGDGARIGNGATVKADVPKGGIVRAGSSWPA